MMFNYIVIFNKMDKGLVSVPLKFNNKYNKLLILMTISFKILYSMKLSHLCQNGNLCQWSIYPILRSYQPRVEGNGHKYISPEIYYI